MIPGFATPEGTQKFAQRFQAKNRSDFYRDVNGLSLSTLGIGTYLGNSDSIDDEALFEALLEAVRLGVNVIDTAINYRDQRSERVIGRALKHLIEKKEIQRNEIFLSTKGGYIPFDGEEPEDPNAYFRDRFLKPRLLSAQDVIAGCHSLAPSFINDQFEASRQNLGIETIDLYYLHNPETQLVEITHSLLIQKLHRAFIVLEEKVHQKRLQWYGIATWNGLRVPNSTEDNLNLAEIVDVASDHGSAHSFKYVQLPFNVAMPEALTVKTQGTYSLLEKARELGIHVFTSASLMQAKVLGKLPARAERFAPGEPDAVKALNFARSAPGVDIALCGMKQLNHVRENLRLSQIPPIQDLSL